MQKENSTTPSTPSTRVRHRKRSNEVSWLVKIACSAIFLKFEVLTIGLSKLVLYEFVLALAYWYLVQAETLFWLVLSHIKLPIIYCGYVFSWALRLFRMLVKQMGAIYSLMTVTSTGQCGPAHTLPFG